MNENEIPGGGIGDDFDEPLSEAERERIDRERAEDLEAASLE